MSERSAAHGAAGEAIDGRHLRGERTRELILTKAAAIASVEGLEGLSIGRLASELGLSKAGVFQHFGSKEQLQIRTVRAAVRTFVERVVEPAIAAPAGARRVWALCNSWLDYAEAGVFPGGCFFLSTSTEFDAREGPVRDELASIRRSWLELYEAEIRAAQESGEITSTEEPAQLAFELDAVAMAASLHAQLCDDPPAFDRARTAMRNRLRAAATRTGARLLTDAPPTGREP